MVPLARCLARPKPPLVSLGQERAEDARKRRIAELDLFAVCAELGEVGEEYNPETDTMTETFTRGEDCLECVRQISRCCVCAWVGGCACVCVCVGHPSPRPATGRPRGCAPAHPLVHVAPSTPHPMHL
jgi:hypothetical protein